MFKSTILFLLLVQIVNLTFGCSKECSECFKCVINTDGEERCVRKPECCPGDVRPVNCYKNPCDNISTQCPDAAHCVADYCGDCNANFYDKNWNKLENEDQCNYTKRRRCRQLPDQGPCDSKMTRWYFDQHSAQCEKFEWGGCGRGNSNNFKRKAGCFRACHGVEGCPMFKMAAPPEGCNYESVTQSDGCATPTIMCPDVGCGLKECGKCQICANTFSDECNTSWNSDCKPVGYTCTRDEFCEQETCRQTYCSTGFKCQFNSEDGPQCVIDLPKLKAVRRCRLNAETGRCRGAFRMFYYDKYYGKCTNFTYGGCGGNMNRFKTEEDCMDACGKEGGQCAVARLIAPPAGCHYKTMTSLTGCDDYVLMCPGLGCATNPCKVANPVM